MFSTDSQIISELDAEIEEAKRMGVNIDTPKDPADDKGSDDDKGVAPDKKTTDDLGKPKTDDDSDEDEDEDEGESKIEDKGTKQPESPKVDDSKAKNKFEERENKRVERIKKELSDEFGSKFEELSNKVLDAVKGITTAKTEEKKDDAQSDLDQAINEYATANNADPESVKAFVGIIEKALGSKLQLTPETQNKIDVAAKMATDAEQKEKEVALFNTQWNEYTPEISKEFPNATVKQLAEAKELMDTLSHKKEFAKYPLDYVLYKNRQQFEDILTRPKRKSAESGAAGTEGKALETEEFDPKKIKVDSPEAAKKLEQEIAAMEAADEGEGVKIHRQVGDEHKEITV